MEKPIGIGSYVRVTSGKYEGKVFEVFDRSENCLRAGINRNDAKLVDINDIISTSQLDFYTANQELSESVFI